MNLCIYCAGGFGKEVLDIARRLNQAHSLWDRIVFLDDTREELSFYGADVFRFESAIERFGATEMQVVIANGEPFVRKALFEKIDSAGISLASLADDSAVISETALMWPKRLSDNQRDHPETDIHQRRFAFVVRLTGLSIRHGSESSSRSPRSSSGWPSCSAS